MTKKTAMRKALSKIEYRLLFVSVNSRCALIFFGKVPTHWGLKISDGHICRRQRSSYNSKKLGTIHFSSLFSANIRLSLTQTFCVFEMYLGHCDVFWEHRDQSSLKPCGCVAIYIEYPASTHNPYYTVLKPSALWLSSNHQPMTVKR